MASEVNHLHNKSSIRHLATLCKDTVPFDALIRGEKSLGGLMEIRGYRSVPSPKHPHPGDGNYFNGGYTTETHGSRDGGGLDATAG